MAYSPEKNAGNSEILRYDLGWDAINSMLRAGRSLSGHERNCCFLNAQNNTFADVSGLAGLDFDDDGRVLAVADWDYDGDIDFWIANRSGPQIRYLQNELDKHHGFVKLKLEGVRSNRDAIGARVVIRYQSAGKKLSQSQTLRAGEGYLAQNSKWLHFGLASNSQLDQVEVYWPGGQLQVFDDLAVNQWYTLREGESPKRWSPPRMEERMPTPLQAPPISDAARIVLLNPIPLSEMSFNTESGEQRSATVANGKAKIVNLWATWCQPCLEEIQEWKNIADELSTMGVEVIALNADQESTDRALDVARVWSALEPPFELGLAARNLVAQFDTLQRSLLSRQRPLPLPSSFLIDGEGRLRIVYKGPVEAKTLLADASLANAQPAEILDAAIPFNGRWMMPPNGSTPLHLTVKYIDNDLTETAREYIETLLAQRERHPEYLNASITNLYGAILLDSKEYVEARKAFETSLEFDPNDRQAHIELGTLLVKASKGAMAEPHFEQVLKANPNDPEMTYFLGLARLQQGKLVEAIETLQHSARMRPSANAHWQLGNAAVGLKDPKLAIQSYEEAIRILPNMASNANNLAWLLSTISDEKLRDGKRGLELALLITDKRGNDPSALDTLAAAYAETGSFARAQEVAEKAIQAATATGKRQLAEKISMRLEKYREQRPHHAGL